MSARRLFLLSCGDDWDWYSLHGGGNWASIEGTAAEWLAVANALRGGEPASFKRLDCRRVGDVFELHSPRNAHGPNDTVRVAVADGPALADEIARELASTSPTDPAPAEEAGK